MWISLEDIILPITGTMIDFQKWKWLTCLYSLTSVLWVSSKTGIEECGEAGSGAPWPHAQDKSYKQE